MRAWLFVMLATLGALVSGCAGAGPAPGPEASSEFPAVGEAGAIQGTVVDEEEVPIEGAEATLLGFEVKALTGPDGVFRIENVPIGLQVVAVAKLGYESASAELEVVSQATAERSFTLIALASVAPYHDIIPYDGRFECSYALADMFWDPCPGQDVLFPQSSNFYNFTKGPGAVNLVAELVWQPTSTATGQSLDFSLVGAQRMACQWYANVFGPSPLTIEVTVGVEFENPASPYAVGTCGDTIVDELDRSLGLLILASPAYVNGMATAGLTLQQPYEGYVTIFYHAPGPAGFSARPDA